MNFNKLLSISFVLITLSSCTSSFRNIVIETSHPSAQMLSNDIKSLTLIDRATTADFNTYDEKKTQQYFFDNNFNTNALMLDSLATDTTLKVLGQLLYDSGAYDVVIPEERFYSHDKKFYEMPASLSWDEVNRICSDYNTDAVLSVERYYNKIFTSFESYDGEYGAATINSAYNVVANIYNPSTREITQQVVASDTITWQQSGSSTKKIFLNLPSITNCVIQTGIQSALDIDARISPQWKRENRIFFTLDKDDSSGNKVIDLANQQEWLKLYEYWLPFEQSKKSSVKSKAEFNLALASEMLGKIDESLTWIEKSLNTKYTQQAKNYMNTLLKRNSNKTLIPH
ncbi:MAG: DUF6340 family protein [Mangrovibacterium sp.]